MLRFVDDGGGWASSAPGGCREWNPLPLGPTLSVYGDAPLGKQGSGSHRNDALDDSGAGLFGSGFWEYVVGVGPPPPVNVLPTGPGTASCAGTARENLGGMLTMRASEPALLTTVPEMGVCWSARNSSEVGVGDMGDTSRP